MLGIRRWLRVGLIFTLAGVLGACNSRVPDALELLDLVKPINVAESGQAVRFEFETNARNFHPGRTYALELELQHQGTRKPDEPDVGTMRIPFEVTLQQWRADAGRMFPPTTAIKPGCSMPVSSFRNGMHPANGGIRRRTWAVMASTR